MNTKLYCPFAVELLFDFFGEFEIRTNETYTTEKKKKVLSKIRQMLDKEILFLSERKNDKFIKWNFSTDEAIRRLENLWNDDTQFSDFYNMVWFGYQEWYIDKLHSLGFKKAENWNDFLNEKIGDLEQWIEENRPKENKPLENQK